MTRGSVEGAEITSRLALKPGRVSEHAPDRRVVCAIGQEARQSIVERELVERNWRRIERHRFIRQHDRLGSRRPIRARRSTMWRLSATATSRR